MLCRLSLSIDSLAGNRLSEPNISTEVFNTQRKIIEGDIRLVKNTAVYPRF